MRVVSTFILGLALSGSALAAQPGMPPRQPSELPGRGLGHGQPGVQRPGVQQPTQGMQQQMSDDAMKATANLNLLSQQMIAVGKLAQQRGSTREVRDLGQQMQKEYTQLGKNIVQWSEQNRVPLTAQPPERYQAQIKDLSGMKGKDFDQAFLKFVDQENTKGADAIESIVKAGGNTAFERQMNQAVPVLRRYSNDAKRFMRMRG
jgi:putative membrane protein